MSDFKKFVHAGIAYSLSHLKISNFVINKVKIEINYSSHCFTEKCEPRHAPDLHYIHNNEKRAFSFERYELSKLLPRYFLNLDRVYHNKNGNFFFWRSPNNIAYLVFFDIYKSTKSDIDLRLIVNSAHLKQNMTLSAAPIKFTTLIDKKMKGEKITIGRLHTIKRK